MERSDKALLAAYLLTAVLGTLTNCLLLNDGAVILSSGWLGNSWDLYISQIASRAGSVLTMVGPAWALHAAFDLSPRLFMIVAHVLYFTVPLLLWLALRAVERDRLFSRLYLAVMLVLVYFPTELIFGIGLWLIWLTLINDPARSTRSKALATVLLGVAMAFTHPALALMGFVFVLAGLALRLFGRRLPDRSLVAVCVLSVLLIVVYFAMARLVPADQSDGPLRAWIGTLRLHQSRLDAENDCALSHARGAVVPAPGAWRRYPAFSVAFLATCHPGCRCVRTMVGRRAARLCRPAPSRAIRPPTCWPSRLSWRYPPAPSGCSEPNGP